MTAPATCHSEESVYRRFHCTPRRPGRVLANAACAPGRGMTPPERGTLIHRLTASVHGDNQPLFSLIAALGIDPRRSWHDGVCALSVDLDAAGAQSPG
ncbi:MAG: hypothetical protein ACRDVE_03515 [Actinocrinis sp.]